MLLSPQFDIKLVFCFKPTTIKMKIKQFKKKKNQPNENKFKIANYDAQQTFCFI